MVSGNRVSVKFRTLVAIGFFAFLASTTIWAQSTVQFIFTADQHYGITRKTFRSVVNADAHLVNAALVEALNGISSSTLGEDGGVGAGKKVGPIDFVAVGGDIANREEGTAEKAIQSAAKSWNQFKTDYIEGINLKNEAGRLTPLYIIPGNHDATNAVGFYKPMYPETDATAMAEIYNMMMSPAERRTKTSFDYAKDKIHYSRDLGGIHFIFISIWPDSGERAWMEADLGSVAANTPVVLFAHDEPEVEAKHFTNPNGDRGINAKAKFENLLADALSDGATINDPTTAEQREFERFLAAHRNISIYFHGNDHWKRYSDWTGPDNSVVLHVFGVDSPMKGTVSAADESKLSFYLVTIDASRRLMTVRDCLWNADPGAKAASIAWGEVVTVALEPRPLP